jgi:hypothetical protein
LVLQSQLAAQQIAKADLLIECFCSGFFVFAAFQLKFGDTAKLAGGLAQPLGAWR